MRPGRLRASPLTRSLFRAPSLLPRSLVDTVYALKDEVQELRQVGRRPSLILLTGGREGNTALEVNPAVHKRSNAEKRA